MAEYIEPRGVEFNKTQTEYQLFPEEYFTATDCHVYFNDVYMDELTGLSFALQEAVQPVFSYASHTWDYVARGTRKVQGEFRIAFKEAGYMFMILDHIGQLSDRKKTTLSYLLNDDEGNGIPHHFGDVLERIEDTLNRYHNDPTSKKPDTTKKENKVLTFNWPVPMRVGDTDSMEKYKNQPMRYNTDKAIRQAQMWLEKNGYGWKATKFNWTKHYGNDTWTASPTSTTKVKVFVEDVIFRSKWINNKIARNSGDWYMCVRYRPEEPNKYKNIGTSIASSRFEKELQQRLDTYPGELAGFWMGSPDGKVKYDGRYGAGPSAAMKMFLKLAEVNDGSNGYWITSKSKALLEQGFVVNGKYDFPTKLAVWAFQEKMIKAGRLKTGTADGILGKATMALMTETIQVDVKVPGESLYKPEELAESRVSYYEREVWGRPFVPLAETVRKQESFFLRGRRRADGTLHTDPLFQEGIDIYINYGPLPQYVKSKLYKIGGDVSFNTTVKALRNVQITDVQQIIDPNTGATIEEVYKFIAKDLD